MSEDAPASLPAVLSDTESPLPDGKKKVIHAQRPNNFYWSLKVGGSTVILVHVIKYCNWN